MGIYCLMVIIYILGFIFREEWGQLCNIVNVLNGTKSHIENVKMVDIVLRVLLPRLENKTELELCGAGMSRCLQDGHHLHTLVSQHSPPVSLPSPLTCQPCRKFVLHFIQHSYMFRHIARSINFSNFSNSMEVPLCFLRNICEYI